jgi:transcriptional antiterminator Rof (Rho-off)
MATNKVSCHNYDSYEQYCMHKTKLLIKYQKDELSLEEEGIITDLYSKSGIEYLVMNGNKTIEMAQVFWVEKF